MSKSVKKYPFVKDRDSSKWGKRYCNRKVRNVGLEDLPKKGNYFKKLVEPWDFIYDYSFSMAWKEFKQQYLDDYRNEQECYQDWLKIYKRK